MACRRSRERKQQIKSVPFMTAARRTPIVTLAIYTKAGRLKGRWREEAGPREGQLAEGLGSRCAAGVTHATGTPRGLAAGAPLKQTGSAVLEAFRPSSFRLSVDKKGFKN